MAWFRKEKKPRLPRTERLEIPADAWEKCEACGHTDLREKFIRNLNVCPSCDFHRRIRAIDYINILTDEGSAEETEGDLRSTDPLGFPEYMGRLKKARRFDQKAAEHARATGHDGPPYAAAMAMPRPRQWIVTDAVSRSTSSRSGDDAA